jgi:hypothetical protein
MNHPRKCHRRWARNKIVVVIITDCYGNVCYTSAAASARPYARRRARDLNDAVRLATGQSKTYFMVSERVLFDTSV